MPNFSAPSTYITGKRDILASLSGVRTTSYTLRAASVSADAAGDKIVHEGTVLSLHSGGALAEPRTSGTAIGVLLDRVNLRDGDADIAMVVAGAVRSDRCWDNGSYGSVAAGVVSALPFVQFVTYDI